MLLSAPRTRNPKPETSPYPAQLEIGTPKEGTAKEAPKGPFSRLRSATCYWGPWSKFPWSEFPLCLIRSFLGRAYSFTVLQLHHVRSHLNDKPPQIAPASLMSAALSATWSDTCTQSSPRAKALHITGHLRCAFEMFGRMAFLRQVS